MSHQNLHLTASEVVKGSVAVGATSTPPPIYHEHTPYLLANHPGSLNYLECIQVLGAFYVAYMLLKGLGIINLGYKLLVKLGLLDK